MRIKSYISWPGPDVDRVDFVIAYAISGAAGDVKRVIELLSSGGLPPEAALIALRGVFRGVRCHAHELAEQHRVLDARRRDTAGGNETRGGFTTIIVVDNQGASKEESDG